MKELRCRDAGADCNFVVRAQTEEELFKKAAEHGRKDHNMQELSEELKAKMRSLIREV